MNENNANNNEEREAAESQAEGQVHHLHTPQRGEEIELDEADEVALDNAWARVAREMGVVAGQPLPWRRDEADG